MKQSYQQPETELFLVLLEKSFLGSDQNLTIQNLVGDWDDEE